MLNYRPCTAEEMDARDILEGRSRRGDSGKDLVLQGNVPLPYAHVTYHIPVWICVPQGYPELRPKVRILETVDTQIVPGHQHVAATDGRPLCLLV